jgi:hydroxymethylglutaryl-CoA reductase
LNNILNQFDATEEERFVVRNHFKHQTVSHSAVVDLMKQLRN